MFFTVIASRFGVAIQVNYKNRLPRFARNDGNKKAMTKIKLI